MTLFSDPFRPFFLLAGLQAALAVPLWLLMMSGAADWPMAFDPLAWHVHEMLFGFLAAVLTGFLFTAIPNWTGRLPLRGGGLVALAVLWLAGRVAVAAPIGVWPAGILDCAFLIAVAALAWREVLAGRNWRNAPICLLVSLFAAANILFHISETQAFGERLALGVAALLIGLVGGRVVPSFTRNWMAKRQTSELPVPFGRFDRFSLALLVAALLAWLVLPEAEPTGWGLLVVSLLHFVRLLRWRGWSTLAEPLVTVLHLGYLWLAASLALMGLAIVSPETLAATAALHALSAGAVGTMTLAIMTRASLGHGGRPLVAGPATIAIYVLVTLGAILRVLAPGLPFDYVTVLSVAALLWSGAFALFVVAYGPMLAWGRGDKAPV